MSEWMALATATMVVSASSVFYVPVSIFMPDIKWTSCCALVKHFLFSVLLIIAWNKQSPLGLAFNIPAFSPPHPRLIQLDIVF